MTYYVQAKLCVTKKMHSWVYGCALFPEWGESYSSCCGIFLWTHRYFSKYSWPLYSLSHVGWTSTYPPNLDFSSFFNLCPKSSDHRRTWLVLIRYSVQFVFVYHTYVLILEIANHIMGRLKNGFFFRLAELLWTLEVKCCGCFWQEDAWNNLVS